MKALFFVAALWVGILSPVWGVNVTFGSGVNEFEISFVEIGDAGNGDDDTGYGGVGYHYQMGQYEVSEDMITKANAEGGLGVTQVGRGARKPTTGISWNEAARFVNWLNTSQGHQAAYRFATQPGDSGYDANEDILLWDSAEAWQLDGENLYRHKDAQYFLPSEDEWYKAAYYDGGLGIYYDYPTGSDMIPVATVGSMVAGEAVYSSSVVFPTGPANIDNAGGLSLYETMGQGGNAWEWGESAFTAPNNVAGESRVVRGGSWSLTSGSLRSSGRTNSNPTNENNVVGFRVASIPEPSGVLMVLIGGASLLLGRNRR
ncbi:MAG: SUMF1/EgtB/PvdO family nonheme iron enzyme [Verrucomicrobiota bacterium]